MRLPDITGVTEKSGIIISKGCQVICLQNNINELINEEIEISLVDFMTGKEVVLFRKDKVRLYGEVTEQGGNKRPTKAVLIEVSDGRDLELNANRVLRVNLSGLTGTDTYEMYAIEAGEPNGLPVIYEQLIVAQGVTTQRFPILDGELLLLPTAQMKDIQVMYSDGSEYRATYKELLLKAVATNGAAFPSGAIAIFIIDLKLANKKVSQVEVNLTDNAAGYIMYKVQNQAYPGFDSRW